MKNYGIKNKFSVKNRLDFHFENIKIKGYSVEENLFSNEDCLELCNLLEIEYKNQELAFSKKKMKMIKEVNTVRMPFLNHSKFEKLFHNPFVVELVEKIIGKPFVLSLQNGVINRPNLKHHQSSWHRDLPYQEWVISTPIAVNAFCCLSDFTIDNGSTEFLPFSHKIEMAPSDDYFENNKIKLTAPAGSVIFFDSMVFHRASFNSSNNIRYGINNLFTIPIIKQQIDISSHFQNKDLSDFEKMLYGISFSTPKNVLDYRNNKFGKL